jgi:MOSC domain-containing protein YiiM
MRVVSTNIAEPKTIQWRGQDILTGIFKHPTDHPIQLGLEVVSGDEISDRRVHGGIYKACYLFSADNYPYWKSLYPHLDWNWGMFGENLSVVGLDETQLCIGDTYGLGSAIIQITQPREPCFKFGVRFGTQNVLQQFIDHGRPGTYVRVIQEGVVAKDDEMTLLSRPKDQITIAQFFDLLFNKEKDQALLEIALNNEALPLEKRVKLGNYVR